MECKEFNKTSGQVNFENVSDQSHFYQFSGRWTGAFGNVWSGKCKIKSLCLWFWIFLLLKNNLDKWTSHKLFIKSQLIKQYQSCGKAVSILHLGQYIVLKNNEMQSVCYKMIN